MARTWLITGCSRGLGRALAHAVIQSGDQLVATARDPETLADLLTIDGDRIITWRLDITDFAAAERAMAAAVERFGSLDIVVNNAGYGNVAPIEDTNLDAFRSQIETNLLGTIIVTKAAIPLFRQQRVVASFRYPRSGAVPVPPAGRRIRLPSSVWKASQRCWRRKWHPSACT
jgi:NAD(P)-dependent dehydrogenase (short-subunit alcohol dehydrogenase family)